MSRYERTPTDILVTPLDLSAQGEEARVWLNKHREIDGKPMVIEVDVEKFGIVETPNGEIYALGTEGVGPDSPISDDNPLSVSVWIRKTEADPAKAEFISMFPSAQFKLGPDEVRNLATGEPVNLADWVRTFGSRLDGNYEGWRKLLVQATKAA